MPRRKVSMGLIPNSRVRATTFAKRKEGLKKKARELATLCGVRVAVVCAADGSGAGAGAAADVWESAAGVLDAYREQVPREERARHTHRAYAELEARKAEAKLVKVRQEGPAALAQWDAAVYALTLDEARRMLAAVDAAVRAVSERRAALGLPVDDDHDGGWIRGFAAPPGRSVDGAVVPFGLATPHPFVGSNLVSFDGGYLQLRAQGGGSNANDNEHVVWDSNGFDPRGAGMVVQQPAGYAFQQCAADMDAYKLQMAADVYDYGNSSSNSTGRLAWDAFHQPPTNEFAAMQPHGYGFQCMGSNSSYVGMSSGYLSQQMPGNSIVTLGGYPSLETGYKLMDAPAAHSAAAVQGVGGGRSLAGGNFTAALPALSLTMGTGDSYVNVPQAPQPLAMSFSGDLINASDYAFTEWSAGQLQSDGSSQQSSNKSLWEAL